MPLRPIKTTDGRPGGWTLEKGRDGRMYVSVDDLAFWLQHISFSEEDVALAKFLHKKLSELAESKI